MTAYTVGAKAHCQAVCHFPVYRGVGSDDEVTTQLPHRSHCPTEVGDFEEEAEYQRGNHHRAVGPESADTHHTKARQGFTINLEHWRDVSTTD